MSRIEDLIPQRPPFLFIDKVTNVSLGEMPYKIVTEKRLDPEDYFWKGHFPMWPVMPGVLLLEGLFQTGAALTKLSLQSSEDNQKIGLVVRVNETKFKKIVVPGDLIVMEVHLTEINDNFYFFAGKSRVDNKVVVSCNFVCALATPPTQPTLSTMPLLSPKGE